VPTSAPWLSRWLKKLRLKPDPVFQVTACQEWQAVTELTRMRFTGRGSAAAFLCFQDKGSTQWLTPPLT
jgi:hypothetical protein